MYEKNFRCKIHDLYGLHDGFYINLSPGYTALIGPNGAGKTTLIRQIEEKVLAKNCLVIRYTNLTDGSIAAKQDLLYRGQSKNLITQLNSSEGQNILRNFGNTVEQIAQKMQEGKAAGKPLFILTDGLDSGTSIDRQLQIMELFRKIASNAGVHPGGAEYPVYILNAVNSFTMAQGVCLDVRTGMTQIFKDYYCYERFIKNYFNKT